MLCGVTLDFFINSGKCDEPEVDSKQFICQRYLECLCLRQDHRNLQVHTPTNDKVISPSRRLSAWLN
jgi:hypothetical protein